MRTGNGDKLTIILLCLMFKHNDECILPFFIILHTIIQALLQTKKRNIIERVWK